eukprot:987328-Prorocentrum_lima.AAC.1
MLIKCLHLCLIGNRVFPVNTNWDMPLLGFRANATNQRVVVSRKRGIMLSGHVKEGWAPSPRRENKVNCLIGGA